MITLSLMQTVVMLGGAAIVGGALALGALAIWLWRQDQADERRAYRDGQ